MAATRVQNVTTGDAGTAAIAFGSAQGWAAPTAGNLLLAWYDGDNTCTAPTGGGTWSAGPSVVDGNACYFWYKIAAGTETALTFTQSASTDGSCGVLEYSGLTATPFDVQNSSTNTTSGTSTTSTSITTTGADGALSVALAALHGSWGTATAPTAPTWTNSYTNIINTTNGVFTSNTSVATFAGELQTGAAGATSTACSWSSTAPLDRQELIIGFKLAPVGGGGGVQPMISAYVGPG